MSDHILTSYFGDIFFEFKVHDDPSNTIVYLPGFPSSSSKEDKIEYLYGCGYNVFAPKYRGTYQSHGVFLDENPVDDFASFLERLRQGRATNLWDQSQVAYEVNELIVFGSSFSGGIATSLTTKVDVDSLVLLAPVIHYDALDDGQDLDHLTEFVQRAFQHVIRFDFDDLTEQLYRYKDCEPTSYLDDASTPTLILHGKDDKTVPLQHSLAVADEHDTIKLVEVDGVAHSSTSLLKERETTWQQFVHRH
jgi:pimeloyl-ACP methyl ester carboxylesterase